MALIIFTQQLARFMSVPQLVTHAATLRAALDEVAAAEPGIVRPLTRLGDYDDWKGHEARVNLAEPLNGRKQFSGTLAGTGEGGSVHLSGKDGNDYAIPFESIHSAKLLLTDKLIASTAPLSTEGADSIQTVED